MCRVGVSRIITLKDAGWRLAKKLVTGSHSPWNLSVEFLQLFCTQESRDGAGTDTESERVNTTITENTQERDTQTVISPQIETVLLYMSLNSDTCVASVVGDRLWLWSNGGMILTGEIEVMGEKHYTVWVVDGWMSMEQWWNGTDRWNWSTGRKTLYSVGGRWMDEYGAMVEWYWQGKLKCWEKNII